MSGAALIQLLRIILGYLSAGLLAAVTATMILGLLYPVAHYLVSEGPLWGVVIWPASLLQIFVYATKTLFLLSFVPCSLLIIASEWRGLRSRKWFMMAGVLVSSLTVLTLSYFVYDAAPRIWIGEFKPVRFVVASFATFIVGLPSALAAGLVYWMIAGRHSGVWRAPRVGKVDREVSSAS
ncbi:MAG: hypothetical protein WCC66_04825 [Rhizobiaceae bacterium]